MTWTHSLGIETIKSLESSVKWEVVGRIHIENKIVKRLSTAECDVFTSTRQRRDKQRKPSSREICIIYRQKYPRKELLAIFCVCLEQCAYWQTSSGTQTVLCNQFCFRLLKIFFIHFLRWPTNRAPFIVVKSRILMQTLAKNVKIFQNNKLMEKIRWITF